MPLRRHSIPTYRSFRGRPLRSVSSPDRHGMTLVSAIRDRSKQLSSLDSVSLIDAATELRTRLQSGQSHLAIDVVCESFALTSEALRRAKGIEYYDVQLLGGLALAAGTVAEIQTGEGKTITTALPAVLHGLVGDGVHVATTNEYLSQRDHEELAGVFQTLGLTSQFLTRDASPAEKAQAYACDVTYGPGYEFGFDFLRDQISLRSRFRPAMGESFVRKLSGVRQESAALTQRGHAFAIIDEADSVLIDEATTPLIMSGGSLGIATDPALFSYARDVAQRFEECDFEVDPRRRTVTMTDSGWQIAQDAFLTRPPGRLSRPWPKLVEHALRAEHLLMQDVDYVVQDDQVMLVDQNTGRIHDERTWSSGLHQAVEVKESVPFTAENETQARITRQRYCGFYKGMCGLTGTAQGGEDELRGFYGLPTVRIPTHKACQRKTLATRSFVDASSKLRAIVADAADRQRRGQPVLIGTRTIQETRLLSERFTQSGLSHVVLNGLQDEDEAVIVAQAGQAGAITVATNMAGRGTDIRLSPAVKDIGGLHVCATEFHHSGRVDRQLAGRSARQGDPGSCQFYASADDEMILNHSPKLSRRMKAVGNEAGECTDDFHAAITRVQAHVESEARIARRNMVDHDQWLESVQSSLARRA